MNGLFRLYVEGSVGWMTLVTLALVAVLIAAWKAPNWVRELGLTGLAIGMLGTLCGLCQASRQIIIDGDISPTVLCGGIKVALITTMYGVIVCLISVVIDLLHRSRN